MQIQGYVNNEITLKVLEQTRINWLDYKKRNFLKDYLTLRQGLFWLIRHLSEKVRCPHDIFSKDVVTEDC